jgi:hypothetical protein
MAGIITVCCDTYEHKDLHRFKMKSNIQWVLIAILVVVSIFLFVSQPDPPPPETITVTKTDTLTQYIESDPIIIEKQVTVRDTIYIDAEGDSIQTEVARLDSSFDSGAELSVSYFISPRVFKVDLIEAPIEVKTITNNVTVTEFVDNHPKWDRFKYGLWSGIATTALVIFLVK